MHVSTGGRGGRARTPGRTGSDEGCRSEQRTELSTHERHLERGRVRRADQRGAFRRRHRRRGRHALSVRLAVRVAVVHVLAVAAGVAESLQALVALKVEDSGGALAKGRSLLLLNTSRWQERT